MADADGLKTRDGLPPTCFEVRGADGLWSSADARIDGTSIVVTSKEVAKPLAVRFAAYNASTPNLVNGNGLPAGPFRMGAKMKIGDAESLKELEGMTCVQRFDIPEKSDLQKHPPKILATRKDVKRVAYLLELQNAAGEVTFAMAAMDAYSSNSDDLVLVGKAGARSIRQPVANLTVRSNSPHVKAVTNADSGFIEFYTSTYSAHKMATPEGGDSVKFDFNDTPTKQNAFGYGCLQIHDLARKATVLAYNRFNNSSTPCDVGIGSNPDSRGNPDWTFSSSAKNYKVRRISVWVQ